MVNSTYESFTGRGRGGDNLFTITVLMQTILLQVVAVVGRVATSYRVIEDGHDPYWIGIIAAAYSFLPLILALPMGRVLDKHGEFPVALAGGLCATVATFGCLWWSSNLGALIAFNALMGVGHLFCMAAGQMGTGRRANRNSAFGYFTMASSIGQIGGPLIVTALSVGVTSPNIEALYLTTGLLSFLLLVIPFWLRLPPKPANVDPTAEKASIAALLRVPHLPAVIICGAICIGANDLFTVFLPLVGTETGLDPAFVGILLGLKAASAVVVRIFFGQLINVMGRRLLLITSCILAALAMACFAVAMPPALAAIAAVMVGVGLAISISLTLAETVDLSPPQMRGLGVSVRLTTNRTLQTVLPLLSSAFAVVLGSAGILLLVSASLVAGAVVYAGRQGKRAS